MKQSEEPRETGDPNLARFVVSSGTKGRTAAWRSHFNFELCSEMVMGASSFSFTTDTATLCLFDLDALKHRIGDDGDWWTWPSEEVAEVNSGSVAFLGLPGDGTYSADVVDTLASPQIEVNLRCPSGRLFVGAAEEATGDGLVPEAIRGGGFLSVTPGNYIVRLAREKQRIVVCLIPGGIGLNGFAAPLRI